MNLSDLIDEINKDSSINFIASAITPLHMIGIQATINNLNDQGIILKGFILNRPHGKTGRIDLNSKKFYGANDIKCVPFDMCLSNGKIPLIESHIVALKKAMQNKQNRVIYVLWTKVEYDWLYLLDRYTSGYKAIYVIIDDGAGSYACRFFNELSLENERTLKLQSVTIGTRLKAFVKILTMIVYDELLIFFIKNGGGIIDNRIFLMSNNYKILGKNKSIASYYVNTFRNSVNQADCFRETRILNGSILFNTQCLVESGVIDGNLDYELYKIAIGIAKKICDKVVIKPHPRENDIGKYNRLDVVILETNCTQESLLAVTSEPPFCVVSIYSSTLLNAKGLFDIPAISLAKIFLEYDLNSDLRATLREFIRQYSNIIMFPSSFEEYAEMIQNEFDRRTAKKRN